MGKTMVAVFFGLVMLVAGTSGAYALQAGGVEIGDWIPVLSLANRLKNWS
ncbi:MAG: hypothetical protein MRJ92_00125 [Nitrospira sp.]|nr:hypothetical protein [Nitrospira sp.]